jgi:hypothetical protein
LNPIDQAGRGKRPYMSNRDLLVIAILSGMGGGNNIVFAPVVAW